MRRVLVRERKNSLRVALRRLEALESRTLLSSDGLANWQAEPVAILRKLTPAETASIPSGYTLNGSSDSPDGGGSPSLSGGYTPAQIRHAYGIDQLSETGTGQTIAIVDAYDDPTIASDLAAFDQQFGLPAATFVKAEPEGVPVVDSGWDGEISLDVEWAHAIAPGAKILLVEALNSDGSSLDNAVTYAVNQGASQVSMSWGGGEYSGEKADDLTFFDHPGVSFFASSGDAPSALLYPAASPYVVSVGGTTLNLDSSGDKISESAWSDGGGGLSQVEPEPSYQSGFLTAYNRGIPDVAYDADPDTGVYIDDDGSFFAVGGTSAGAPQWAALAALANQGRVSVGEAPLGTGQLYGTDSVLYDLAGKSSYLNPNDDFSDITTGSNGHSAGPGYDQATGLGSPVANNLIPDLIDAFGTNLPTIVNSASATPNPVTGKTTQLSVLANDSAGASTLTYTWTTISSPAGATAPTFSINGTNAAKNDTATFSKAGVYIFEARATDPLGLSVTSSVTVHVNSTFTTFGLSPAKSQLSANGSEQFFASGVDQFGNLVSTSTAFTWTLSSGGGTISSSGLYVAPATGTIATVKASSGGLSLTSTVYVLSNPWSQTDIGNPSLAGNAADNSAGLFTLLGSGTGVTSSSDQFQFAYLPVTGNSTVEAQVATIQNTSSSAIAGVMVRGDTSNGSLNVMVAITPADGLEFSYRSQANGQTTATTEPRVTAGDYVKIVRLANLFTGYYSTNGVSWTEVGAINLAIGSTADAGLAVSSSSASALNTATFNHVLADSVPTIVNSASANPNPVTSTTTTLAVLGADSAGESGLTYTWAVTALPAGAVTPTFATNGTNASKKDLVTFYRSGSYSFTVTLVNALGYSTTSSVTVTVLQTQTAVKLTPSTATLIEGESQQFVAGLYDQFGYLMPKQPLFTYSVISGGVGGKISSQGLYTAPTNRTGIDFINVTGDGTAATAEVYVTIGAGIVTKSNNGSLATVGSVSVGWGSDSAPLFTANDGLRLLPAGRQIDLPWANIQTLTITLNQAETLTPSDIKVTGLTVANYGPVTVSLVAGTAATYVITLAQPITVADRVTLTISSPEITTYIRRLDVLPGDVNDDGVVNAADATIATAYLDAVFLPADIFGDGVVSARSVKAIQLLYGTMLP